MLPAPRRARNGRVRIPCGEEGCGTDWKIVLGAGSIFSVHTHSESPLIYAISPRYVSLGLGVVALVAAGLIFSF